jgi:hypothetical protein
MTTAMHPGILENEHTEEAFVRSDLAETAKGAVAYALKTWGHDEADQACTAEEQLVGMKPAEGPHGEPDWYVICPEAEAVVHYWRLVTL